MHFCCTVDVDGDQMTAIALFGGSFNPPHVAHQMVGLYVLESLPVDELWLVPTWVHPFGKDLAPYEDRVAMCELAAAALGPRGKVSRIEEELAQRPGFVASRTLDTLEAIAAARPGVELRLVIGADILGETAKWYRWDEVVRRAPPIVVSRGGYPRPPGLASTEIEITTLSSTEVRDRLARGEDVSGLLPRSVMGYIADRGLYR
jgi:nicotinate-nucleotide adenylyltransferase